MASDAHGELRRTIDQLHAQLRAVDSVDEADREKLQSALAEIQSAIAAGGSPKSDDDEDQSLLDRLQESTDRLEASHPDLAGMIGGVIDAIGRMGI